MTDALLDFGLITLGKAASGDTSASPGYSANCVDFKVDEEDLANLLPAVLVIIADGAVTNAKISLYTGSSDNPTTALGDGYPVIASMVDGERKELQLPLSCSRYLRVGGTGTGKVKASIEMGGRSNSL